MVSLGSAGILLAALVLGHYGCEVPSIVQNIGLACFVTSVGFIAGPAFVSNFRGKARAYVLIGVSIIGADLAGIRRGKEHIPADQRCADRGVFVIENLCGLDALLFVSGPITIHTYPARYTHMTGLPCRVVAEV